MCALDERDLHLTHEDVHVVARVAHEREAFAVARDVAVVLEQLGWIVALEQIRRAARPAAVERLEVRARRAHVPEAPEVGVASQRRAVGCEVVCDVLAEERPACFDRRVALAIPAVAEAACRPNAVEHALIALERR